MYRDEIFLPAASCRLPASFSKGESADVLPFDLRHPRHQGFSE
jgi:hypothetical protein